MSAANANPHWAQPILPATEVGEFEARLFGGDETREWLAMQAAGRAVAEAALRDFEAIGGFPKSDGRLLVLVGKGHNGGDALIAAEAILEKHPNACAATGALARAATRVQTRAEVVFVFGERALRPLAWRAWGSLQTRFPEQVQVLTRSDLASRVTEGAHYALCLDGVFGFQFRSPLDVRAATVLAVANALPISLRAAVDLPSGLGEAGAFRADFTYATGVLKREVLGRRNAGRLRYLDLGFFKNAQPEIQSVDCASPPVADCVITPEVLAPLRGWRDPHSDKRAQGHVFVVAGSREYPGAALMCVLAALRSGAGLVTAFVPESFVSSFAASVPEAIWVAWPETPNGGLALEGEHLLRERLARAGEKRALVIGPGIGREREIQVLVGEVLKTHSGSLPVVLDADALQPEFLKNARGPLVLTPHAGEFRRLGSQTLFSGDPLVGGSSGNSPEGISGQSLRDFARRAKAVVVLKGPVTRICDGSTGSDSCISRGVNGERSGESEGASALPVYHSLLGGPVLARGGTGDLLAGMISVQLSRQPSEVLEATCRAVAWHGLAAEALERVQGAEAVRTTDLLNTLGIALRQ